ncbi:polysaccharide biosynthesis/export family protein [Psychrobacter sp. HD31]|uniref:polysaccharide biosynthesis/export family protein n=1 Tax=Psychrobacter sp. HD31 TaxID=3112003 RepID=UPI003DA6A1B4
MNKQYPLTVAICALMVTQSIAATTTFGSNANMSVNNEGLANTDSTTTAEAVAAASMPSSSIIYNSTNAYQNGYQDSNSQDANMFGSQLFRGAFATGAGSSFNQSYVINPGDNVQVRMWGAYQFAATMTVDPQGNIFLPNVGPVRLQGVSNGKLQNVVQAAVRSVYRANVGVYAALEEAQPVKVFVTGFVNQPGYYGGLAADSAISYLDRAGGVDPQSGSYISIQVIRHGRKMIDVNLYDFLLFGALQPFAFRDGDVIKVSPQQHTYSVSGSVKNEYTYEFNKDRPKTVVEALRMAAIDTDATHVSITRGVDFSGREQVSEYYPLNDSRLSSMQVTRGDHLVVSSDRYAGTIAVQVKGAHTGNGALIVKNGTHLKDVIPQLQPTELANLENLTIYRASVAEKQKKLINESLNRLEEMTLASQSTTREEAELRQDDANLIKQFIAKARQVKTDGRIVVVEDSWQDIILQQGDIIEIPEKTSVITVNGQVLAQGALTFNPDLTVGDYVAKSGGFNNNADEEEILVVHQNGETQVVNTAYRIQQGDEIMVLPKIKTKNVEIARGLSQIFYQIAIATKVVLGL